MRNEQPVVHTTQTMVAMVAEITTIGSLFVLRLQLFYTKGISREFQVKNYKLQTKKNTNPAL